MSRLLFLFALFLMACSQRYFVGTVDNNVCKTLKEKVVVVPVFVDSDETHPWSAYDIRSTTDSIHRAMNWIEAEAAKRKRILDIQVEILKHDSVVPVKEEFQYKTLSGTLFKYMVIQKGIQLVDNWANAAAKKFAKRLPGQKSTEVLTNNRLRDAERLIASLRDKYGTDNIALLFFINNYYENEMSVVLHSGDSAHVEYGVVSQKKSTVIAHEFLHLFGAWDLYRTPFDKRWLARLRKHRAMKQFPNEIMAFAYRDIDKLEISPLTEYLIGWAPSVDKKLAKRFLWRRFRPVEY